jgi:hypothetical protein
MMIWILRYGLLSFVPRLLESQEQSGEDGAADAMPGTADGARQYGKGLGGKEITGENGCQSGVLHTHLNADGAFLGFVELSESACQIAEDVPQGVMTEHHRKGPKEE